MCLYLNWIEPRDHLDLRLNDIHIFHFKIRVREIKSFKGTEGILIFSLVKAIHCNNT